MGKIDQEQINAHNLAELDKFAEMREAVKKCLANGQDPAEYIDEVSAYIKDIESQIELFEFSKDEKRRYFAYVLLASAFRYKAGFLELSLRAEKDRNAKLHDIILNEI